MQVLKALVELYFLTKVKGKERKGKEEGLFYGKQLKDILVLADSIFSLRGLWLDADLAEPHKNSLFLS